MAWNGSGTFSRTNGTFTGATVWADDRDAGTKITAANHDTHDKDLADGIHACLCKNGENKPSANIDWNGKKITNAGAATGLTDYVRADQIQKSGLIWAGTSAGEANTYELTLAPAPVALVNGLTVAFCAHQTSTDTIAIVLNALASKGLASSSALILGAGHIVDNGIYVITFNETTDDWYLVSGPGEITTAWSPTVTTSGAGGLTNTSVDFANYKVRGDTVWFEVKVTTTPVAALGTTIYITLPINAVNGCVVAGAAQIPVGTVLACGAFLSTDKIAISRYDYANLTAAESYFYATGEYRWT